MSIRVRDRRQVTIYRDPSRYTMQVGAVQLDDGEILVVFNEARAREHLDSDSIALVRSPDGLAWDPATHATVWARTEHLGSDTPSIRRLSDGTLLCTFLMTAFVGKKGVLYELG
jgi:hypothetical protein